MSEIAVSHKKIIFGTTLIVPADTIVESEYRESLLSINEGENYWSYDLRICLKLSHVNFPRHSRKFDSLLTRIQTLEPRGQQYGAHKISVGLGPEDPLHKVKRVLVTRHAVARTMTSLQEYIIDEYLTGTVCQCRLLQQFAKLYQAPASRARLTVAQAA